jgi:pyruvate dehydrogenase E1 component alpha subunit
VWKLPSIFICENNLYGEYSAYDETAPVPNVADRALAYNMPSQIVDGQDVEAVVEAIQHATDRARNGGGPTLIEAKTYRYRGHSRSDNAPYRKPGELDEWLQRDPIHILAQRMIADGQLTEAEFAALKQRSADAVEDATTWAMSLPDPVLTSALEDIWA